MAETLFTKNLDEKICKYCGRIERIVHEFEPADVHETAECAVSPEPFYVQ